MPCTIIPNGAPSPPNTIKVSGTFTGDVYLKPVLRNGDLAIGHVTFLPGARTFWHTHENGQFIHVVQGTGWVCDKGEKPRMIKAGDMVWCESGCTHWHGADDNSIMTHFVFARGKTTWREEVTNEEYAKKSEA